MVLRKAFLLIEVLVAVVLFSILSMLILKFEHLCLQTKNAAFVKNKALNLSITTIEMLKTGIEIDAKNDKKQYEFYVNFMSLPENEFKSFRMAKISCRPRFGFTKHHVELVSSC